MAVSERRLCQTSTTDMSVIIPKHILLTGPSGIGKTTLIKKVYSYLKKKEYNVKGFYTDEVRDNHRQRTGFDVITLDGKKERLARILNLLQRDDERSYRIGQYFVFPSKFEKLVCPILDEGLQNYTGILILDEIGKMELISEQFQNLITKIMDARNYIIIATIPLRTQKMPLIEALLKNPNFQLLTVTKDNRDTLVNNIAEILNILKHVK